ncbi:PAS domain S-box protein [Sphingobium sp. DEHP117]|uniref:PAS domain S-box protein n=1 Tax=Sphingobium sp. DEHP117 TaxID=2993436 RepID=UPI0027D60962|nr:PAS domain S-box protein [Sphingobium sp. DEHP117]MDQ4419045.1 PAS domain S-box protein [Sphingobium sp. DEHP117]
MTRTSFMLSKSMPRQRNESDPNSTRGKLSLKERYQQRKIDLLNSLKSLSGEGFPSLQRSIELQCDLHKLAGSASHFGDQKIGDLSGSLDEYLQNSGSESDPSYFRRLVAELCDEIEKSFNDQMSHISSSQDVVWNRDSYAKEELRAVIDTMLDGLIVINDRGIIRDFTPVSEKLFGYSTDEVIGQNISMLMPEPDRSNHDSYLDNYAKGGLAKIVGIGREVIGQRKDGSTFPMELGVSRFEIGGKKKYVGICRDITQRKRDEKIKDEFISTVSHELRSPLTSLQASLGLLLARHAHDLDEQGTRLLSLAHNGAIRLSELVNDILDLEKIAAGKLEIVLQSIEIGPLVQDIVDRHAGLALSHDVQFETQVNVSGVKVRLDPNRFNQALVNLLSNAAKFSDAGDTVLISAELDDPTNVRIAVKDNGPGIPLAFQSKIFQRFAQADSSTTRQQGGSGLGLNITKSLIEEFGGTVNFESTEGKGTSFYFVLPVALD